MIFPVVSHLPEPRPQAVPGNLIHRAPHRCRAVCGSDNGPLSLQEGASLRSSPCPSRATTRSDWASSWRWASGQLAASSRRMVTASSIAARASSARPMWPAPPTGYPVRWPGRAGTRPGGPRSAPGRCRWLPRRRPAPPPPGPGRPEGPTRSPATRARTRRSGRPASIRSLIVTAQSCQPRSGNLDAHSGADGSIGTGT